MAPRAYWKGSLKLSLGTCPIALYPASTQAEKTHFHQINTKTGHRLKQQMVDEQTGRVVDKDHKGRGCSRRDVMSRSRQKSSMLLNSKARIPSKLTLSFQPRKLTRDTSTSRITSYRTARRAPMRSS
jgi:hypothetical protein